MGYQAGSLTQTVRKDDPSKITIGKFWNFNKKVIYSSLETKMLKLTLVMTTILLHAAASQPVDVNVEVTVNGVKIPIGLDQPGRAGMLRKMFKAMTMIQAHRIKFDGVSTTTESGSSSTNALIVTGTETNQLSTQLSTNHQPNDVSYYNGPEGAAVRNL